MWIGGALGELAGDALEGSAAGPVSARRPGVGQRYATVSLRLADLRAVRDEHSHTINDVVLAVVTGTGGTGYDSRGVHRIRSSLTALVPMSVTEDDGEPTSLLQPGRPAPAAAADRRAQPVDAAAPGTRRRPTSTAAGRWTPVPVRHRRVRPDHPARSAYASRGSDACCTADLLVTNVPGPGAAVRRRCPAGGELPGAAAPGPLAPLTHWGDVLQRQRLRRFDLPTATRSGISTCWPRA